MTKSFAGKRTIGLPEPLVQRGVLAKCRCGPGVDGRLAMLELLSVVVGFRPHRPNGRRRPEARRSRRSITSPAVTTSPTASPRRFGHGPPAAYSYVAAAPRGFALGVAIVLRSFRTSKGSASAGRS